MKDTFLNEYYEILENELNDVDYVNSLKELIESNQLNETNLKELIKSSTDYVI